MMLSGLLALGLLTTSHSPLPDPELIPKCGRACAPVLCPIVRKAPWVHYKGRHV